MTDESPKLSLDPNAGIGTDHVVYVELDALLDTRLGTLNIMDPKFAEETVSNPGYFKRVSDDFSVFCGVSFDAYKEAYRNRNIETLQNSVVTNASFVLNSVCNELLRQQVETPFAMSVTVEVNYWPYVVDQELRIELDNAITALLPFGVAMRSTSIPVGSLTVQRIADTYSGMLIYNFAEWLQIHATELENVRIPGVTILAPKLHAEGHIAFVSSDLGEGAGDIDPYEMIAMLHAPLFGLDWLEPHHYCMITQSSVDAHAEVQTAQTPQGSA